MSSKAHLDLDEAVAHCAYIRPTWYGAKGDGKQDDTGAILAADRGAASRGVPIYLGPGEVFRITRNIEIAAAVHRGGGRFVPASGVVVTLNGAVLPVNRGACAGAQAAPRAEPTETAPILSKGELAKQRLIKAAAVALVASRSITGSTIDLSCKETRAAAYRAIDAIEAYRKLLQTKAEMSYGEPLKPGGIRWLRSGRSTIAGEKD